MPTPGASALGRFIVTSAAALLTSAGFAVCPPVERAWAVGPQPRVSAPVARPETAYPDLRTAYGMRARGDDARPIGRLAALLLARWSDRRVPMSHGFASGDRFRFEISSNNGGWLYVMHRSPAGQPQRLWPRIQAGTPDSYLDDNRVHAGQPLTVPPSPGSFMFDEEVGAEYFYVVIAPRRDAPRLEVVQPPPASGVLPATIDAGRQQTSDMAYTGQGRTGPTKRPAGNRIVQFSVRGAGIAPYRGVVFDPGPGDGEPYTYFTPHPETITTSNVFEFRLRHVD